MMTDIEIAHSAQMLPIGEIAALVGFTDQFYFCRVFRKTTGLSPLEYRKKHVE